MDGIISLPQGAPCVNPLPAHLRDFHRTLCRLAASRGECYAGNAYLAGEYGKHPHTITRWIADLIHAGYIEVIHFDGRIRHIRVLVSYLRIRRQTTRKCVGTHVRVSSKTLLSQDNKQESAAHGSPVTSPVFCDSADACTAHPLCNEITDMGDKAQEKKSVESLITEMVIKKPLMTDGHKANFKAESVSTMLTNEIESSPEQKQASSDLESAGVTRSAAERLAREYTARCLAWLKAVKTLPPRRNLPGFLVRAISCQEWRLPNQGEEERGETPASPHAAVTAPEAYRRGEVYSESGRRAFQEMRRSIRR